MALFEADTFLGRHPGRYQVPRQLAPSLIDFWLSFCTGRTTEETRRVGNILHTSLFGDTVLRKLTFGEARGLVQTAGAFLFGQQHARKPRAEHHKSMWGVIEDIIRCPAVTAWLQALLDFDYRHGQHGVLTCDGTVKVAMSFQGYSRGFFRGSSTRPGLERSASHLHCARDGRFRSRRGCGSRGRYPVRGGSAELHTAMAAGFQELHAVLEDPTHIVMRYKSAQGNQPTAGSHRLSQIVSKFSPGDEPTHTKRLRRRNSRSAGMHHRDDLLCMAALAADFPQKKGEK